MGISISDIIKDVEKSKILMPQLETVFTDVRQLVADLQLLEAAFKALTPPVVPPPSPAA